MALPLRTADQLIDAHIEARWAARRSGPWASTLQDLWRLLLEREGPIPVDELHRLLPGRTREAVPEALTALDADDLIVVRDGRLTAAYPFSGEATAFAVILPDGRHRYACCAIDALGIAPMLGQRIEVGSPCHHCGQPLAFAVAVDGPAAGAAGVMVWVGQWGGAGGRRATSL